MSSADLGLLVPDETGAGGVGHGPAERGISAGDPEAHPRQRGGPGLQHEGGQDVRGTVGDTGHGPTWGAEGTGPSSCGSHSWDGGDFYGWSF